MGPTTNNIAEDSGIPIQTQIKLDTPQTQRSYTETPSVYSTKFLRAIKQDVKSVKKYFSLADYKSECEKEKW